MVGGGVAEQDGFALTAQQRILIVGDFDCDGATSSALCVLALRAMGSGQPQRVAGAGAAGQSGLKHGINLDLYQWESDAYYGRQHQNCPNAMPTHYLKTAVLTAQSTDASTTETVQTMLREIRAGGEAQVSASLLAAEVIAGRLELPLWNDKVEQWITRVNCLSQWMPDLEIPAIGEEDRHLIIEQVCTGCIAYRQLKDKDIFPALHQWLSH